MSVQRDGGPAFPGGIKEGFTQRPNDGMSLRDWIAGQALAAMPVQVAVAEPAATIIARSAYTIADAMLAAREVRS